MSDRTYVPLQPWSCDKCGKRGDVEVSNDLSVVERVRKVCADHYNKSPECGKRTLGAALRFGQVAPLPD